MYINYNKARFNLNKHVIEQINCTFPQGFHFHLFFFQLYALYIRTIQLTISCYLKKYSIQNNRFVTLRIKLYFT